MWWSSDTEVCPERLCSAHLQGFSRNNWTKPWETEFQSGYVGRDFWRSSVPSLLPKEGCLRLYLQGWRFHNLSGQPVLVLHYPHSKKVLQNLLCFILLCLLSCHWALLKRAWLHLLCILKVFIYIDKTPSESFLLQAEQSQLPQLFLIAEMFQSLNHFSGSFLNSPQYVSLLYWGIQH